MKTQTITVEIKAEVPVGKYCYNEGICSEINGEECTLFTDAEPLATGANHFPLKCDQCLTACKGAQNAS